MAGLRQRCTLVLAPRAVDSRLIESPAQLCSTRVKLADSLHASGAQGGKRASALRNLPGWGMRAAWARPFPPARLPHGFIGLCQGAGDVCIESTAGPARGQAAPSVQHPAGVALLQRRWRSVLATTAHSKGRGQRSVSATFAARRWADVAPRCARSIVSSQDCRHACCERLAACCSCTTRCASSFMGMHRAHLQLQEQQHQPAVPCGTLLGRCGRQWPNTCCCDANSGGAMPPRLQCAGWCWLVAALRQAHGTNLASL